MDWLLVCAAVGLTVTAVTGLWNAYQFSRIAPSPAKHGRLRKVKIIKGVMPAAVPTTTSSITGERRWSLLLFRWRRSAHRGQHPVAQDHRP